MPQEYQHTSMDTLHRIEDKLDNSTILHSEQHTELMSSVSVLQMQMVGLLGNGQPGRITTIEGKVDNLTKFRYVVVGYAAAISGFVTLLWHLWPWVVARGK